VIQKISFRRFYAKNANLRGGSMMWNYRERKQALILTLFDTIWNLKHIFCHYLKIFGTSRDNFENKVSLKHSF